MQKNIYFEVRQHQLVFWLGALAGAVVISLIFFYRLLMPGDYESFTLNPVKTTIQQTQKSKVLPKANVAKPSSKVKSGVQQKNTTTKSFPTPQGGKSAFPTPQGGYSAFPTPQGG